MAAASRTPRQNLEGFSGPASDMFRIAVNIAGFDAGELMKEINRRAPRRATIDTVCNAMQKLRDRFDDTGSQSTNGGA